MPSISLDLINTRALALPKNAACMLTNTCNVHVGTPCDSHWNLQSIFTRHCIATQFNVRLLEGERERERERERESACVFVCYVRYVGCTCVLL